jgi:hypothetical protein
VNGTVTVSPETFALVLFDSAAIARVAAELLPRIGLAVDLAITVDETTPIARCVATIVDTDHVAVHAESGAFEDARRPRNMSEVATATSLGRVLMRVRDRLDGSFADAPDDDALTLSQISAWDTYCIGRLGRLGYRVHEPRWRYNFRNRHGFSDTTDEAFDRTWTADQLTWGQLAELSHRASV